MAKTGLAVAALILIIVALICLMAGSTRLDFTRVFTPGSVESIVFMSVRLPRVLAAALAGLAFALSGLLLQVASGNDLASPNIIGVNSGSGFAVLLFLCFLPQHFLLLPFAAFAGAMSAAVLVFTISSLSTRLSSSSSLILAGVAVNALFNALISTLSSLKPEVMGSYSAFSVGGFASIQPSSLVAPAVIILISSVLCIAIAPVLDVIRLGDEIASSLGYRPRRVRMLLSMLASLMAGAAVSFAGLLGFVGLVTPHLANFLTGGDGRRTVVMCALSGPTLVLLSDLLARTVVAPGELPAGVFMAAIGVPFLVYLLTRRARHA